MDVLARWCVAALLVVAVGCKGEPGSPTAAFRDFLQAAKRCDRKALIEGMTGHSNQAIERTMRQMRTLMPADKAKDFDFYTNQICKQLKADEIEMKSESVEGSRADLTVDVGGRTEHVPMVLEDGRWKLDFLDMMRGNMRVPPVPADSAGSAPRGDD